MGPNFFSAYRWNTENYLRPYLAVAPRLDREQLSSFHSLQGLRALLGALLVSQAADRHGSLVVYVLTSIGFGLASIGALAVTNSTEALLQRLVMGFFLGGIFGCAARLYVCLFPQGMRGMPAGLVQLVYNGGDETLSWFGRESASREWRHVMVIGGVGAILSAAEACFIVSADKLRPKRHEAAISQSSGSPFIALFREGRWKLTVRLAVHCGLNFFAFQCFNGWPSTCLTEDRHLSADIVGRLLTSVYTGSMVGRSSGG